VTADQRRPDWVRLGVHVRLERVLIVGPDRLLESGAFGAAETSVLWSGLMRGATIRKAPEARKRPSPRRKPWDWIKESIESRTGQSRLAQ